MNKMHWKMPLKNVRPRNWFAALASALALAGAGTVPAQGLDMGDASVLSQQGQRLKIAVPFGSKPGEDVSLLRFQVQSVQAGENEKAPSAKGFTISKPEKRNVIFLQSSEIVNASNLKLVLTLAGSPEQKIEYDLQVPEASATGPVMDAMVKTVTPKQKGKNKRAKNKAKRSSKKAMSKAEASNK